MSHSKLSPARRIAAALLPITALSLAACGSLPSTNDRVYKAYTARIWSPSSDQVRR